MIPLSGGILQPVNPVAERSAGVTETDHGEPPSTGTPSTDKPDLRRTRGIRFSDSEWEEVKAAAERNGISVAEFVRFNLLAIARGNAADDSTAIIASLVPLIERTFRYTWILATYKRNELIQEDRLDEVEKLVKQARELQESLQESERRRSPGARRNRQSGCRDFSVQESPKDG